MSRWKKRRRVASGFATVAAAIALVALGPVGHAHAEDTVDQITGNGVTDSAVTVAYSDGRTTRPSPNATRRTPSWRTTSGTSR
jgi:hypothetical protein